ncbi:MAG TPA: EAL domain-containing protein, partial [Methylophilaceae bacterium]|nr:EAL domain-containing protein [Methylophilaceae bacterium]
EVRAYPSIEGLAVYIRDVTERKQTEIELARLNRALRLLGTINESLIHLSDEQQLLEQICRLAVEVGGYKAAWVGYAHDDAYKTVEPKAFFGNEEFAQFISDLKVSWNEQHALGNGPSGRVIRSGNALVIEDISKDPQHSPWLAAVQSTGHHGVITLPLKDKHEATFGQLSLYSGEVRKVAEAELKLLGEMADDLAFGIRSIRSQQDRSRIQAAMMKVAASVSASTGTAFFEQLVRNMVDAMGADAGFVARLMPGERATAQTLVAIIDGEIRTNFTYSLEGTPCENLIQADDCVVPSGVNRSYPFAQILSEIKAEAYVGGRLTSSSGQIIGLLFVLFRAPLKNTDFIKSTLQIFAARAAAELERQEADIRLREQASLLDKAQDAIIVLGTDNKIQLWSKGAERLYGWTAEETLGTSLELVLHEDPAPFLEAIRCVMEKGEWNGEIMQRRKDRSTLIVEGRWTLVRKENNEPQSILAINTDITQRRAAADEIQHLAFYDVLTGLPNRQLLRDRLKHVLTTTPRSRQSGALLFIDLDNFKTLNDTLGHDKGDLLLQEVAKRLMTCVRKSDTVARLGGDEFVVLLENLSDNLAEAASQSKLVGEKILSSFNEPYELANYPYHSTPSIGITLFDPQHINADELLKRADIAMYQAKAAGKNSLRFFDPEMQAVVNAKVELEADLRQGFQQHEFHLHYQPQIDHNGDVTGAEALLRWQHPQRGFVSPAAFIPVAEETGLIIQLGKLVLETACKQLAAWALRPETSRLSIAVNVSARQFRNVDFVEQVVAVLQETGAHPQRLKLELTESLLLDNLEETIKKMSALKAHGVCFALDDFGTGYSSLSYLKRLPLDQLKIDQSFVRDVLDDPNDTVIVRTIIALGQNLGLEVIAEGVETLEQRNFLTLHGCEAYQGYYFSRPLAIDVFEEFILKN